MRIVGRDGLCGYIADIRRHRRFPGRSFQEFHLGKQSAFFNATECGLSRHLCVFSMPSESSAATVSFSFSGVSYRQSEVPRSLKLRTLRTSDCLPSDPPEPPRNRGNGGCRCLRTDASEQMPLVPSSVCFQRHRRPPKARSLRERQVRRT